MRVAAYPPALESELRAFLSRGHHLDDDDEVGRLDGGWSEAEARAPVSEAPLSPRPSMRPTAHPSLRPTLRVPASAQPPSKSSSARRLDEAGSYSKIVPRRR
jgi:hypothetical protein